MPFDIDSYMRDTVARNTKGLDSQQRSRYIRSIISWREEDLTYPSVAEPAKEILRIEIRILRSLINQEPA